MSRQYVVTDFGAVADGATVNTSAIQSAVDACATTGGRVVIPPGVFLTGSLRMKSGVELHLSHGAVLKGSPFIEDYPALGAPFRVLCRSYAWKALVWALDARDIAITGTGTLDGNGGAHAFQIPDEKFWENVENRPYGLYFARCEDVLIADVTLRDSAFWMQHHVDCRRLRFQRMKVFNFINHNNDGLDLDNCRDVIISDCQIECSDDAICIKSMTPGMNERITVTNCILRSHYNAFKVGTETAGGLRDFTMSNCVLGGPVDVPHKLEKGGRTRAFAGIALMSADGATLENIAISNITIHHVQSPIFIRLQSRGARYWPDAPAAGTGRVRGIMISHVVARDLTALSSSITGVPGSQVEDVTLRDITLDLPGGGRPEDVDTPVPEKPDGYPDCVMFGTNLPSSALYVRHARNITLKDWKLRFPDGGDIRPAFVADDVEGLDSNMDVSRKLSL